MSADNWSVCPKCKKKTEEKLQEKIRDASILRDGSYGEIPIEDFLKIDNALHKALAEQRKFMEDLKNDMVERTFREVYEIYGAETGIVKIEYSGECSKCDIVVTFKHLVAID